MTNEESDIYKINHAKGAAVEVSQDTITLIKKGIYYSEMTDGAFDITIGAVSQLWDFHAEDPKVPSSKARASARSHVNYKNIILKDNTVMLTDPKAAIDLSRIHIFTTLSPTFFSPWNSFWIFSRKKALDVRSSKFASDSMPDLP